MILIVHVKKDLLKKGQCLYTALRKIPHRDSIDYIVFYDSTYVYATPKLFGISRDKCELIKLFTNKELGVRGNRTHPLLAKHRNATCSWINWDYPVMFNNPVRLNTERVNGFRIATEEEEKEIMEELKCLNLE